MSTSTVSTFFFSGESKDLVGEDPAILFISQKTEKIFTKLGVEDTASCRNFRERVEAFQDVEKALLKAWERPYIKPLVALAAIAIIATCVATAVFSLNIFTSITLGVLSLWFLFEALRIPFLMFQRWYFEDSIEKVEGPNMTNFLSENYVNLMNRLNAVLQIHDKKSISPGVANSIVENKEDGDEDIMETAYSQIMKDINKKRDQYELARKELESLHKKWSLVTVSQW